MELIGRPLPQDSVYGPISLLLTGNTAQLDGLYMRHVIFDHVEIHYSGSPVILEDVRFVNCTFVFDNVDHARLLGEQILAEATVNFHTTA